ncbi:MAG: hypothetical protein SPI12_06415 [Actinomycetaceae bacterium]|nr:hypothetical protein [Actinomycetaceae bacterium]
MKWIKETNRKIESYFGSGFIPVFGISLIGAGVICAIISFIRPEWEAVRTGTGITILVGIVCAAYGRIRHVHRNPPREEPHQD